jgi:hypothetical protein
MTDLLQQTDQDAFAVFWSIYPRRTAKTAARKSWERATQKIMVPAETILAGARAYREEKAGSDEKFIAHPATWLNQQRWADERNAPAETAPPPSIWAVQPQDKLPELPHDHPLQMARRVLATRDRIIERTRSENKAKIEEAARRLETTETEMWSCLLFGFDGVESRAYDAAVGEVMKGKPSISHLNISASQWISARDRKNSRKNIAGGMRKIHIDTDIARDNQGDGQQKEEIDDLQPTY